MSDKNTISINVKFDKDLTLLDIEHVYEDQKGNKKSKNIKKKDKFKIDFDKIHTISNMTLIKGDVAGVDPYCILIGGQLFCFP